MLFFVKKHLSFFNTVDICVAEVRSFVWTRVDQCASCIFAQAFVEFVVFWLHSVIVKV